MIRAVLWDFGGVILSSPFEAFSALRAASTGSRRDFIRAVNATDPDANAWARSSAASSTATSSTPRSPTSRRRSATSRRAPTCSALLAGEVRPEMVVALDRVKAAGLHDGVPHEQRRRRDGEPTRGPTSPR